MLKRQTLALLALLVSSTAWSQQPQPNTGPIDPVQAPHAQQQSQPDKRGTREQPLVIETIPTPKTEADHAHEAEEKAAKARETTAKERLDTDLVRFTGELADWTLGLFAATGALFVATLGTLIIGVFQVRQMRAEFRATHRPRIGIRGVHTLTRDNEGFLAFVYVNRGIGDAKVISIGCAVILGEFIRNAPAFEIQDISAAALKSGDSRLYEYIPHNAADFSVGRGFKDRADPRVEASTAFFVGYVIYQDSAGRRRETGFCRKNAPGTDLWVAVENSGYEYED